MCFGILFPDTRHWFCGMSRWGRKKYEVSCASNSRRASSFVSILPDSGGPQSLEGTSSGGVMTPCRNSNLNQIRLREPEPSGHVSMSTSPERNGRSHSLTNLSIEPLTSPPPLPPRRRIPAPIRPTILRRVPQPQGDRDHLQFPPEAVIPVLERNAVIRNSRLMLNHPFVYFRFDSGPSENFRAMNVVPLWVDDDQPPSYDEAVKMNPQKEETEVPAEMENVESNQEQILTTTTVIEMEQTSESESIVTEKASDSIGYFRRETSV